MHIIAVLKSAEVTHRTCSSTQKEKVMMKTCKIYKLRLYQKTQDNINFTVYVFASSSYSTYQLSVHNSILPKRMWKISVFIKVLGYHELRKC